MLAVPPTTGPPVGGAGPWAMTFVALAYAGELLKHTMDRQDWKSSRGRLDRIMEADPIGAYTHEAVEAAQAAAVVAATSGSVAATG